MCCFFEQKFIQQSLAKQGLLRENVLPEVRSSQVCSVLWIVKKFMNIDENIIVDQI